MLKQTNLLKVSVNVVNSSISSYGQNFLTPIQSFDFIAKMSRPIGSVEREFELILVQTAFKLACQFVCEEWPHFPFSSAIESLRSD
jgi:hypothetical protein